MEHAKTLHCSCGACGVTVAGAPRLRLLCHCSICRRFNAAPYADIAVYRRDEAVLENGSPVAFRRFKSVFGVDRGACERCAQPVVEYMQLPLLPGMAFVPVALFPDDAGLPEPALHMFYDGRVHAMDDGLPHYEGFLPSQFAAARRLIPALLR